MPIFNKNLNKKGFTILELLIVILIIWFLASNAYPKGIRNLKTYERYQKYCFSNQRVLLGAIEMYNMDNSTFMENALPGPEFERCFKILQNGNYFKGSLNTKDYDCEYGFIDIMGSGNVFCKIHGCIPSDSQNSIVFPKLEANSKNIYYDEYQKLKTKMEREIKTENFKWEIISFLIEEPKIPGFLLVLTFILFIINSVKSKKNK